MTQAQHTRLSEVLGGDALAWLRKRLRDRIARGDDIGANARLANPNSVERQAIERLLGIPGKTGKHLTVRISDLEYIVTNLGFDSLQSALELLDGPIISRAEMKAQEDVAWKDLLDEYRDDLSKAGGHSDAIDSLLMGGCLRRISKQNQDVARDLLSQALKVVRRLRTLHEQGERVCRAALSAEIFGDSHALDSGQPVVTILKAVHDMSECDDVAFWSQVSIECDATTSSVLVLNARFKGGDLANALNLYAEAGEPCRITLNTIDRGLIPDCESVFVCENPSVLGEASRRYASKAKPMICTEGQPSIACQRLLGLLSEQDTSIHYHGDFDWGGIRIGNFVHRLCGGFVPWQYNAVDYLAIEGGFDLAREDTDALWDTELCTRMRERAVGVHEEMILDRLLADLA